MLQLQYGGMCYPGARSTASLILGVSDYQVARGSSRLQGFFVDGCLWLRKLKKKEAPVGKEHN